MLLLPVTDLLTEIGQGEPTLKRKFEDNHGNENGVDSPSNLTTDENRNGINDHDGSTAGPILPTPEVSLDQSLKEIKVNLLL